MNQSLQIKLMPCYTNLDPTQSEDELLPDSSSIWKMWDCDDPYPNQSLHNHDLAVNAWWLCWWFFEMMSAKPPEKYLDKSCLEVLWWQEHPDYILGDIVERRAFSSRILQRAEWASSRSTFHGLSRTIILYCAALLLLHTFLSFVVSPPHSGESRNAIFFYLFPSALNFYFSPYFMS